MIILLLRVIFLKEFFYKRQKRFLKIIIRNYIFYIYFF